MIDLTSLTIQRLMAAGGRWALVALDSPFLYTSYFQQPVKTDKRLVS
jgi:hypothetical protein